MNVKQTIAIVGLCCLSFVAKSQSLLIDKVVAVVGEEIILYSDIQNQVLQAKQDPEFKPPKDFECVILEEMLYQKLLLHQAELDSIEIPEEQIEAELNNRINYFCQLLGSCDALEEYYGMSIELIKEEFRHMVEDNMQSEQMEYSITSGAKVTPAEIKDYFKSIPSDSLPRINSQVEVGHIVILPKVTEEDKNEVYQQMLELKGKLESGASDWCVEAILVSDDDGSAINCGKLGWQNKDLFVPEFAAMAMALDSGEISDPFWSDYGCHIMKLIDRRGNEVNVQHILVRVEVGFEEREDARLELEDLKARIEADSLTFEDATFVYSDDDLTKNNGGRLSDPYTGMSKLDMGNVDGSLGLVLDRLDEGEISPPMPYVNDEGDKGYRIIMLYDRSAPHIANLEDDYQMFKNAALATKKGELMDEWLIAKISTSYVKVDSDFTGCDFQYGWLKQDVE